MNLQLRPRRRCRCGFGSAAGSQPSTLLSFGKWKGEKRREEKSDEPTLALENPNDDHCEYDSTHRLQLTFDKESKDPTKGYSFRTNSQICDVVLGPRGAHQSSGLHFCIAFDVTFGEKKHLMLRDSSANGTAVSYSGQAREEVRHHFTWILDLEKEEGGGKSKSRFEGSGSRSSCPAIRHAKLYTTRR